MVVRTKEYRFKRVALNKSSVYSDPFPRLLLRVEDWKQISLEASFRNRVRCFMEVKELKKALWARARKVKGGRLQFLQSSDVS